MAFTVDDVDKLKVAILGREQADGTRAGGVIQKIENLASGEKKDLGKNIIGLIGSILELVMTGIQAAID